MSKHNYLTKTDYKLARECPTKLYYSKQGYSSNMSDNEYLEFLKDGGHIIGEMARILHPEGRYIGIVDGDFEDAALRTKAALKQENATLFEAVFIEQGMLAAVDILEKRGTSLSIIEVKSKSYDSTLENQIVAKKGEIREEWREYIDDLAFQYLVVKQSCTNFDVVPYLLLPDKSKSTTVEGLSSLFRLEKIARGSTEFYKVKYLADPKLIQSSNFLTRVNLKELVDAIFKLVQRDAHHLVSLLRPELIREQQVLSKICKSCEFKVEPSETQKSGFHECWKELALVKPHIFDLYHIGSLKVKQVPVVNDLISQGKVSLYDVPAEVIKGKRGERQSIQIEYSKLGKEWINPNFSAQLRTFKYPLHFIDFETATSALPYHKGMHPYEQIAFQWSCHTITELGAPAVHTEWINLEQSFPSFEFAETLRQTLSEQGTILMWARHENLVLKDIKRQALKYNYKNSQDLCTWIDSVAVSSESSGRLIDMNELCLTNYFHPEMKGKTSIKYVLPAIWKNNPYLWESSDFQRYFVKNPEGIVLNPYDTLPGIDIAGTNQVVKAGTGAMSAYQEMMFGLSKDDFDLKHKWKDLLIQYCCLDTTAMLIIWTHWNRLLEQNFR